MELKSSDSRNGLRLLLNASTGACTLPLSIDGTKKSGKVDCDLPIPKDLFEREIFVDCGRSMLKRFQMDGLTLEKEHVSDRLLLTY
jgi:DNA adenine methylase